MKYSANPAFLFFFMFLFFGCGGPADRQPVKSNNCKPGQIDPTSKQSSDNEKTSALTENHAAHQKTDAGMTFQNKKAISFYLPKKADKSMTLPVIFIFDPGADGAFPVESYKALAEKFGYALVGSNISKNGQDLSAGPGIFKEMKREFSKMQLIDEKRVYTMGFSGGARVAASIAMDGNNIAGVIGCGAGLPGGEDKPPVPFDYFGMVGNQDFNMTELIRLDISLEKAGFNNELLVFDGKHAWPPEEQMKEAFLWLEINAMKHKIIPRNETLIAETAEHFDKIIKQLENDGRIFDASKAADRAVHFLSGLAGTTSFENRYKALSTDPRYKKQFEYKVKIMQEEMGEQNKLLSSFTTMDLPWWEETVKELYKPLKDTERQNMNRRLLAWLGLVAYLSSDNALKKEQDDVAGQFLQIYSTIEPMNPEHAYLGAVLQMQLKKPEVAIEYLKQAMVLGFRDGQRMAQDTAFVSLHKNNAFNSLLQEIK